MPKQKVERDFDAFLQEHGIEAAHQFDALGRPGAKAVQKRQQRIATRLAEIRRKREARDPKLWLQYRFRCPRLPQLYRLKKKWLQTRGIEVWQFQWSASDYLVFADWLEEQGEPAADAIRAAYERQIEARRNQMDRTVTKRGRRRLTEREKFNRRAAATGDKQRAIEAAWAYHRNVKPLFRSKRGTILWGNGGQDGADWDAYNNNHPARWKNAGVWVSYATGEPVAILENYRGTRVAEIEL